MTVWIEGVRGGVREGGRAGARGTCRDRRGHVGKGGGGGVAHETAPCSSRTPLEPQTHTPYHELYVYATDEP